MNASPNPPVAVIDIGSNSIKLLVAETGAEGRPRALFTRTLDARISAGIGKDRPRLGEEGLRRGVEAVRTLAEDAARFGPRSLAAVATAAVREAENGEEFRQSVLAATGLAIRVLSGEEEANLIGRGLVEDPALAEQREFYVFDLGGGSLECLAFRARAIEQRVSLPLGCVRTTEKFVADSSRPLRLDEAQAIADEVRRVLRASGFAFSLPAEAAAIGTGGTLTAVRTAEGARGGLALEQTAPVIPVALLRDLLARVGAMTLAERKEVPGLPSGRADVFPAALVTFLALAELGSFPVFVHSLFNLRWGLAAEMLAGCAAGRSNH